LFGVPSGSCPPASTLIQVHVDDRLAVQLDFDPAAAALDFDVVPLARLLAGVAVVDETIVDRTAVVVLVDVGLAAGVEHLYPSATA
jgi:hypothetical protein